MYLGDILIELALTVLDNIGAENRAGYCAFYIL